jgi:hypothetical protein
MESNHMTAEKPKYDVAISFLYKDLATATALSERLGEGLEVFFYPRKQEELTGTDGMVSMREPFFRGSRLVVVLYDEPWGETPWTRIEQTAIQERCLQDGWDGLYFITVGRPKKLPPWMPSQLVRFSLQDFPIEQAVGAIKARVQELGGKISPMTPAKMAQLHAAEVKYQKQREVFFRSQEGMNAARAGVQELFAAMNLACETAKSGGVDLAFSTGRDGGYERFVVTNGAGSLAIEWVPQSSNMLLDAELVVDAFDDRIALPGAPRLMYFDNPPRRSTVARYRPELGRDGAFCWRLGEGVVRSQAVADECIIGFLERANQELIREARRR